MLEQIGEYAISVLAEHAPLQKINSLNRCCTLINRKHARVAQHALDRPLLHVAGAAEHLDRRIRIGCRRLGANRLRHRQHHGRTRCGSSIACVPLIDPCRRLQRAWRGLIIPVNRPALLVGNVRAMTTKVALVINLKTAKALDLSIPPTLIFRADEVIE